MPFIQINLGEGRTAEQKDKLIRAVSAAAADAISVPEASVRVWLVEVPATEILVGGQTLAERQAGRS
ncbi:tautomerase family protein [Amycolatopsis thermophila]|uniref:4-oxalocrotonate tautomerase n=1 Tax=Amycolatopsis thermophila TaxID=206084 RepID=A0ABU0F027_9PSEU|nr:tautomerase family protein [Amycolatopsis thermophila]MDQ0380926.1 4-oxalocrotonate tautomerase [Amycolatopsis thermophila]